VSSAASVIEQDAEETWPDNLLAILETSLEELRHFEIERRNIDALMQRDIRARIHTPHNKFAEARSAIVERCRSAVRGAKLVGYHCTRLLDQEAELIWRDGLKPASSDLAVQKIDIALSSGAITRPFADKLRRNNLAGKEGRVGLLWFVTDRETLRDAGSVERLLRSWGGEAVYWGNESGSDGTILGSIGTPTIITAHINVDEIKNFDTGTNLLLRYLSSRGVSVANKATDNAYVKTSIPGALLKFHRLGTETFEHLTGESSWTNRL